MKNFTVSLLVLITILLSNSAQAQVNDDQARNYQINSTHTGSVNTAGVVPPLRQKWSVNFGQNISYPLIVDGKVFVTVRNASTTGSTLYALDAANGATIWSYDLAGSTKWSALCYENGRVFAINWSGMLRAFDGATGNVIWSKQLSGVMSSAPTVFQGVIYISAGGSAKVYAVSADNGDVIWSAPVVNGDMSSPAVTTDGVYVSYSCPNVYKLNPANGAQIWKYGSGCSGGGGKTTALYNGRLYARDYNPDYIIDSQTGLLISGFTSKPVPAFSGNRGFFLNGPKGHGSYGVLEGRDVNSHVLAWTFPGDGYLQSSMLVVNDHVYVGSNSGKLYAVNAATGQLAWSTTAGTSIPYVDEQNVSQPLTGFAAGEGILVIPTATTLVAYEGDPTPTITWDAQIPAANAYGWNSTPVDLSFTASAPLGVASTTPGSPIRFNSEGDNQTQEVTITDLGGHSTIVTSPAVRIDLTAPVTTSAVSGTVGPGITAWYKGTATVSLTKSDNLSGVRTTSYTIDGGPTQTYVAPFVIQTEGSHTVNFWSSDYAGNNETPQSIVVNVDVTSPTTQISIPVGNQFYATPKQVELTATDAGSGVANTFYTINGGPTQTYSAPFMVSGDGNHMIVYWSADWAGNVESQTYNARSVRLDGVSPTTDISSTGTNGWNGWRTSAVQVTLWPSDARSGLAATYYSVDGGPTQTYSSPFTVDGSAQHSILYWSVDNVGNTETQKSGTIKIDKEGPTTESSVTGPLGTNNYYRGSAQVTLTATDTVAGLASYGTYYKIDAGPLKVYMGSPFTVSGEGAHSVSYWSQDLAGNTASPSTVVINIDSIAPSTQPTLSGTAGANGWYSTAVQVTLGSTDATSGVGETYYAIDGGLPQPYSTPFSISNTGTHSILYWSSDLAGNAESSQAIIIKVDVSAPSTQATISGTSSNGWYQNPAQVSFTATDGDSGVGTSYYAIDGGATQTYASPFNVSAGGSHTVKYWSVDAVGNTESEKSLTVQVDVSAPSTQLSPSGTAGTNGWYLSPVQVALSGSDNQAGVANTFYSLNGGASQTYAAPFTVNSDGQHQVKFWSVDSLGNAEAQQTVVIKIDATSPTTQNAVSGPVGDAVYFKGAVQFSLTSADNLSGVATTYYRVDGGATQVYSGPFTVSGDGTHPVNFWSVDAAGNSNNSYTVQIRIDATAPFTTATPSGIVGTNGWHRGPVQVALSATDSLSGVANRYYKINGGTTQNYSTPFTVSAAGTHTITFWSTDLATNTETVRSLVVKVDSTNPVITASASPSSATKSNSSLSVTVSGKVTDTPSGVKPNSTTFSVLDEYGVTQPSGAVTVQANGNYSFVLSLPRTRNAGDSNGHLYTITVRSDDQAGNSGAASTTLKIN